MKKILMLTACALAVVAAPVAAKKPEALKPAAAVTACTPIQVAYVSYGTLVDGALVANPDGTYSGSLTVAVSQTNEHARADRGVATTYALNSAALHLHGQDPAALSVGSRVKLIGTTTVLPQQCDPAGFVPTTVIARGFIKSPKL
jgi:lipoprotein-anchoring transpeptidase ErfK/SrfK